MQEIGKCLKRSLRRQRIYPKGEPKGYLVEGQEAIINYRIKKYWGIRKEVKTMEAIIEPKAETRLIIIIIIAISNKYQLTLTKNVEKQGKKILRKMFGPGQKGELMNYINRRKFQTLLGKHDCNFTVSFSAVD